MSRIVESLYRISNISLNEDNNMPSMEYLIEYIKSNVISVGNSVSIMSSIFNTSINTSVLSIDNMSTLISNAEGGIKDIEKCKKRILLNKPGDIYYNILYDLYLNNKVKTKLDPIKFRANIQLSDEKGLSINYKLEDGNNRFALCSLLGISCPFIILNNDKFLIKG